MKLPDWAKWIARDADGRLNVFDAEPEKDDASGEWLIGVGGDEIKRVKEDEYVYRDIKWADEKARAVFNPLVIHQEEGGFPAFKTEPIELERIDIIRAVLNDEEFRGFLKGNILKYQHSEPEKARYYYDLLEG